MWERKFSMYLYIYTLKKLALTLIKSPAPDLASTSESPHHSYLDNNQI